jgi:cell division protein ZapA (FtsZ GTPase activity inhibitor)
VKIGGMNYQLLAAENETYIRKVAAQADEMIRRVMQNNPHLTLSMSTVLALVNAVDEQYGLRREQEDALHKQEEAMNQLSELKEELMRCREQTWEIKRSFYIIRICAASMKSCSKRQHRLKQTK